MSRRRVFRTSAECPGMAANCKTPAESQCYVGKAIEFETSESGPEINIILDGVVVGKLDAAVQDTVRSAMDRGQSLKVFIEKAGPVFTGDEPTSAYVDIKMEYMLPYGVPAIGEVIPPVRQPSVNELIEPLDHLYAPASPKSTKSKANHRSFFTKIAGVTHNGRQRRIKCCAVGEELVLVRDPGNRYDKGAIRVQRLNGDDLGFIPAHVSRADDPSGISFQMDHGSRYRCIVKDITGGGPVMSLGMNIEITEIVEDYDELVKRRINELTAAPIAHTKPKPQVFWILAAIIGCVLVALYSIR